MGVFYNPQGAMPIAQMGFNTQVQTAPMSGGSTRQPKGRDVQAEKWDEEQRKERLAKQVIADGGGDIEKTSLNLEQVDPKFAQDWEKNAYANSLAESTFLATKAKNHVELSRMAADAADAGNMTLANQIVKSIDPNMESISNTKNKDIKELSYRDADGKIIKEPVSVNGLIKAGTDSATQFTTQATMDRLMLQYSEKNPENTLAKIKAKVFTKMNTAQELAATHGTMDKAVTEARKKGIDIEFTPAEVDAYTISMYGNIMTAAIQAKNANPEYIKIWDSKKLGMSPAEFIAKNDMEQLALMQQSFIKNLGIKMKGEGSMLTPAKEDKKDITSKISTTTKSHPTASSSENVYAIRGNEKIYIKNNEKARKWAVDNNYTIEE